MARSLSHIRAVDLLGIDDDRLELILGGRVIARIIAKQPN
jgi:hypothetical protein